MKYLFTNKSIKVGDTCIMLCLKEHLDMLRISQYFKEIYDKWEGVGRVGIKVIKTFDNKLRGYLVYQIDKSKKLAPRKINDKLLFVTITTENNVGLIKYDVRKV